MQQIELQYHNLKNNLSQAVMLILIFIFATVHSGLASLRDVGEQLIGERPYRVLFAGVSLPLALSTVVSNSQPLDSIDFSFLI